MKNLKKYSVLFFLSLVTLSIALVSCDKDDDDNIKSVLKFNPGKVEVEIGKTASVVVSGGITPYSAVPSDTKIASVKADKNKITITGVKKGSTTIMVTDKNKNSGKITVTVKDAASVLDFDKKTVSVAVGKEDVVTVKEGVAPYTAVAKDTNIATVSVKDSKVTIKGVKAGTTTIAVTDKNKKNGTIIVTVK